LGCQGWFSDGESADPDARGENRVPESVWMNSEGDWA
jgi:hypothetical protein